MNLFNKPTVCYGSKSPCARGGTNSHLSDSKQGCDWKKEEFALLWFVWMSGVDWPLGCGMPWLGVLILHLLKSEGSPAGFSEQMH